MALGSVLGPPRNSSSTQNSERWRASKMSSYSTHPHTKHGSPERRSLAEMLTGCPDRLDLGGRKSRGCSRFLPAGCWSPNWIVSGPDPFGNLFQLTCDSPFLVGVVPLFSHSGVKTHSTI